MPSRSWRAAHPVELREDEDDVGGWHCQRDPPPRCERALCRLTRRWQHGSPTWIRTRMNRLTAGSLTVSGSGKDDGGGHRNRTDLSLLAKHARGPNASPENGWCLKMESNHRRARLQRAALPLSYSGKMVRTA
jgi:hypothetical protein